VENDRRVLVFGLGAPDCGIPASWAAEPARAGVHLLPDLSDASIDSVASLVDDEKRSGDIVVASIHWGGNWGYEIPQAHRRFARGLIDRAAVDVVHGHSSHHPKAIEIHNDRLILYGCGDFLDDYEGIENHEPFRDDLVLMYFPALDAAGRLLRLEMSPLQIRNFRLRHLMSGDRRWLRSMLDRECREFGRRVVDGEHAFALV
jgi:poly-gamma-glutamate synthesis protein (capsule biosynthesis protein)